MAYRQIEWIDPIEAASRLAGLPGLAWLDSAMAHPTLGRYSTIAVEPCGVFTVRGGAAFWNDVPEREAPLAALRARLAACRIDSEPGLPPFQGGAIGYIGYEFGWALEGLQPPQAADGDDMHLAFYDTVLAFDHVAHTCFAIAAAPLLPPGGKVPAQPADEGAPPEKSASAGHRPIRRDPLIRPPGTFSREGRRQIAPGSTGDCQARLETLIGRLDLSPRPLSPPSGIVWSQTIDRETYCAAVARVRELIAAGDVYQANIAQRFTAVLPAGADPLDIYRTLRAQNPATFAAYLDCGARHVLSTSPELFLRTRGRAVETRPIKGTTRRLADADADADARAALLASRKDRAENVMIVDLLRNDLSKVCVPASVHVPVLCGLESYAGLHHLVSSVTGTLAPGADALDLVAATFPGGSITGAPKLRAMEIIADIEGGPRGVYCGAIGAIGFDGDMVLNIAIRTLVVEDGEVELRTGGGITLLSDPEAEHEETLVKARRIFEAFSPDPAHAPVEAGA